MFMTQVVHDGGHMRTPSSKDSSRPDRWLNHKDPVYVIVQRANNYCSKRSETCVEQREYNLLGQFVREQAEMKSVSHEEE